MSKRRWTLAAIAYLPFAVASGQPSDSDVIGMDALTLRAELAAGSLSAERVTEVFLRRIATLDDSGPTLGAVIEVNPDALAIARALDAQRKHGDLGPLHGLPVLLKANIDTADRMATSAGSAALATHHASEDAEIVSRLRAAGAVLLGKTNLSEWANFRSTHSTSGWSSLGGQTRNPYVLDRNPCGSSSGSAVAVAARLAPLAVGTETDGSIVCPAAANGVVGIKPTIGTVSQRGIVPVAASQDTAGPFARTVADAVLLLGVLAEGRAPAVPPTARESLAGVRIGVIRNYYGAGTDPAVEAAFSAAVATLEAAGATLIDPVNAALPANAREAEFTVLLAEFRAGIDRYLTTVEGSPRTLDEIIEFNAAHADEVMPYFGQELLLDARASDGIDSAQYQLAVATIAEARAALAAQFATQDLDALVAPANAPAWRTDWQAGDAVHVGSSSLAAVTGYPSIVVPMSLTGELPLGLALIGQPLQEYLIADIAAVIERLRGPFPAPRLLRGMED
jgi:amidase